VQYLKPSLSFADQAQRLIQHGLVTHDVNLLIDRLSTVSYYRLSAYWYPFKQPDDHFVSGTTFETVWRRYTFDRHLRLVIMDAIERIEVALLRTRLVELFTLQHGPFGYRQINCFHPKCDVGDHTRLLSECDQAFSRSSEAFVKHFRRKYTAQPHPPLWMMVEVMTYGQLFTMYRLLSSREQKSIATGIGVPAPVLGSWLHTLNYVRNAVAHHARLWNREIPIKPMIPWKKHRPEFHTPLPIANDRVFGVLSLLRYLMLNVAPQSRWSQRLIALFDDYPDIPYRDMGFPINWKDYPLWKL
jgi:abortive infection bacteriophage resistance protein